MEKNIEVSILLDLYGNLLTQKQRELLDDYYNNDLSLSEIAENSQITRQAVRDNLKKGENNLFEYEEKLGFKKRLLNQEQIIENVFDELKIIEKNIANSETQKSIEKIKKHLNNII